MWRNHSGQIAGARCRPTYVARLFGIGEQKSSRKDGLPNFVSSWVEVRLGAMVEAAVDCTPHDTLPTFGVIPIVFIWALLVSHHLGDCCFSNRNNLPLESAY